MITVKEFVKKYNLTGKEACSLLGYTVPQHLQRAKTNFPKNNVNLLAVLAYNEEMLKRYYAEDLIKLIEKEKMSSISEFMNYFKISEDDASKMLNYTYKRNFNAAKDKGPYLRNGQVSTCIKLLALMLGKYKFKKEKIFNILENIQ